jgi:hypothetical protein
VLAHVTEFVANRCAAELDESGVAVAGDVLVNFVNGGKCVRSTFMYLPDSFDLVLRDVRRRRDQCGAQLLCRTEHSQESNIPIAQIAQRVVAGDRPLVEYPR